MRSQDLMPYKLSTRSARHLLKRQHERPDNLLMTVPRSSACAGCAESMVATPAAQIVPLTSQEGAMCVPSSS